MTKQEYLEKERLKYKKYPMVCNGFAVRYPWKWIKQVIEDTVKLGVQAGVGAVNLDYAVGCIAELIVKENQGGGGLG